MTYRRMHDIPDAWGTAVNVQAMVFGNMGETLGHRRRVHAQPLDRREELYGEFLINAQGEDVVAGIRTPQPLTESGAQRSGEDEPIARGADAGRVRRTDRASSQRLEQHYRDMQDIEFTIENGKLWMLQTRTGKRTAEAALKIAVDLVEEGLIRADEAVLRVDPGGARPAAASDASTRRRRRTCSRTGLPASPGAAAGEIVFDGRRGRGAERRRAARSSSCAPKPAPKTSTACTRRAASSPRAAA